MRIRNRSLIALGLAGTLRLTACGSDDDGGEGASGTGTGTERLSPAPGAPTVLAATAPLGPTPTTPPCSPADADLPLVVGQEAHAPCR
jgi:hypothetical protein